MSLRCVLYFYQKSTNNVQVDEKEPSLHTINKNHPVKYPVLATFTCIFTRLDHGLVIAVFKIHKTSADIILIKA
jgi:hypothetical protein